MKNMAFLYPDQAQVHQTVINPDLGVTGGGGPGTGQPVIPAGAIYNYDPADSNYYLATYAEQPLVVSKGVTTLGGIPLGGTTYEGTLADGATAYINVDEDSAGSGLSFSIGATMTSKIGETFSGGIQISADDHVVDQALGDIGQILNDLGTGIDTGISDAISGIEGFVSGLAGDIGGLWHTMEGWFSGDAVGKIGGIMPISGNHWHIIAG